MSDPFGHAVSASALPALDTPRLHLRPFTEADDPAILTLFSDPKSLETWTVDTFTTLDDARAYRESLEVGFARRSVFAWGVFERETSALVGVEILVRWAPLHRRVYLGYYLGSAHWGKGYATEAGTAVLRFAFDVLDCHRVEVEIVPGNMGSERVAERLGFTWEARLRERLGGNGGMEDGDLYYLFARDFRALLPDAEEAA